MKAMINKLTAAILLMTAALLTACGKGEGDGAPIAAEYVYKAQSAEISGGVTGDYDKFCFYNGKIYFISGDVPDSGSARYYLNIAEQSGECRSALIAEGEGISLSPLCFSPEGRGYYTEISPAEDGITYTLREVDENGAAAGAYDITAAVTERFPDMYPSCAAVCGDNILFGGYFGLIAFGADGSCVGSAPCEDRIVGIAADKSGRPCVYIWNGGGYELRAADIAAGELGSAEALPFEGYGNIISCGKELGYDLLVSDGTSLFGYDLGGEKTELLNWIQSGVSPIEVSDIFCMGDTILTAGKSFPYGYPKLYALTKCLKDDSGRTELILAGSGNSIDGLIENSIVKFNASNDKYFITVKKYSYEDTDKLNLDIISGRAPDILVSDPYMPVDTYISKELLADMYGFIDSDPELDRSAFLPNLLSACETNGRLYRFADRFKVYTVLGKTSVFGEIAEIDTERLGKIAAAMPEGTEILPACTKNDILIFAMELSGNGYVSFKDRTCSFDSDSFIKLLEYADNYLSEQDQASYFDDAFWSRFDAMYADGSALLMLVYLSDYSDIYRFERVNFGERVTAVGFPCEGGNGTSFIADTAFSLCESSANKEGAWEFVRTLLLPAHQDSVDCFPSRTDCLEKAAAAAMKHDPDRVNYAVAVMGQMIICAGEGDIGEPSAEDIDRMNKVIASASGLMTYDENIMSIILEEAGAYFDGARTAKEAAELIQMRVKLYLNE